MSVIPTESRKINNTVLNVNESVYQGILESSPSVTFREFEASSNSISSSNYDMQIPREVILNRKIYIKSTWQIVFTGTTTSASLLNQSYDALRSFPVSRAMDTAKFTINGNNFSANISEYIDDLLRYEKLEDLQAMSTTPNMLEQSMNYSDLQGNNLRNPLNGYADSNGFLGVPRGAFALDSFVDGTTTSTIQFTTVEPFFMSPWLYGEQESKGLYNVQNITANINWNADLSACMWSHAPALSTLTNLSFTLVKSSIMCQTMNPNSLSIMPEIQQFNYISLQPRSTDINVSLGAGLEATNNTNTITLQSIPSYLMLSVKEKRNDRSFLNPLTYASIEAVSVYWMNQTGNLSGCTKEALYAINKRNGLNMSYSEWSGQPLNLGSGAQISGPCGPLLLKFGVDLPISSPDMAPSSSGSFDIQVQITYKNRSNRSVFYSLYLIPVYEGISTIYADQMITQVGQVTKSEVMNTLTNEADKGIDMKNLAEGGNFFRSLTDKLKKYVTIPNIRKARAFAQKAIKPFEASPYANIANQVLSGMEAVGLGENQAPKRSAPKKSAKKSAPKKSAKKGGVIIGGKPMSRDEMKRLLGY